MDKNIVSIREIQRNYRKLINLVKKTKRPLYLGARNNEEAVLLDVESFNDLHGRANRKKKNWKEIKKTLNWIAAGGKQGVSLAKFVHEDRKRH